MFQQNDIVAVYGETPASETLNDSHPSPGSINILDESVEIPENLIQAADRYTLCTVRRVLKGKMGEILVVNPLKKPASGLIVHANQCKLVERGGRKLEPRRAKYIATLFDENLDERADYEIYDTLQDTITAARQKKEEWEDEFRENNDEDDMIEVSVRFYKAIDISDEVSP